MMINLLEKVVSIRIYKVSTKITPSVNQSSGFAYRVTEIPVSPEMIKILTNVPKDILVIG